MPKLSLHNTVINCFKCTTNKNIKCTHCHGTGFLPYVEKHQMVKIL